MSVGLPCSVLIWWAAPIEPRRVDYPKVLTDVTDPPLDIDESPGWLDGWACWPVGWHGKVTYAFVPHSRVRMAFGTWTGARPGPPV